MITRPSVDDNKKLEQGTQNKPENTLPGFVSTLTPEALLDAVRSCLDDGKAEDIVAIELAGKSSLADYMVIASGRSNRHVAALADSIAQTLKEPGQAMPPVEGLPQGDWVLLDAGDVIVHIFRPEVREFYRLEDMWSITNLPRTNEATGQTVWESSEAGEADDAGEQM